MLSGTGTCTSLPRWQRSKLKALETPSVMEIMLLNKRCNGWTCVMGTDHRLTSFTKANNAETPRTMGSRELVNLDIRLVRSRDTTKLSLATARPPSR